MRNILLIIILVIFTIIAFAYFQKPSPAPALPAPSQLEETSDSQYLPYSPETFTSRSASRRVLFFYANWCPTCRPIDNELRQNEAQIPADVIVYRVNYNDTDTDQTDKELAAKYNITYQHTFVQVDQNGNALATWNGGGLSQLIANLK